MPSVLKNIAISLLLASFLSVALFGFVTMSSENERIESDCPFSATGAALCSQDAFAVTLHHFNAYQSFLNVPVSSVASALIGILLFAACLLALYVRPLSFQSAVARGNHFNTGPPVSVRTRKITRWLSLLENSPSSP